MEVKAVEILWMAGEFPVDRATREIFFHRALPESSRDANDFMVSRSASLDRRKSKRRIVGAPKQPTTIFSGKL
jgi:hypothetical protein